MILPHSSGTGKPAVTAALVEVTDVAAGSPLAPSSSPLVPKPEGGTPAFPPLRTQAAGLFDSLAAFVGDGFALVDDAEYRRRLTVSHACDRRVGRRCAECGCWIGVKARGRAFRCPLDRWK